MTEPTTAAPAAGEATPIVDKIDQIFFDAIKPEEPAAAEEPIDPLAAGDDPDIEPAKEPTEKSYLNALAKAKGKATKERFLRQELERRIADLEARKAPEGKTPPDDGRPKEENYGPQGKDGKTWGDYARDLARYEAKQLAQEMNKTTREQASAYERQERIQERVDHAADNSVAAAKAFADFKQVESENMDVIRSLPEPVKELLREADNPAYAFYQLAKDGQLDQLADVSPARAALLIARAEDKALASKKPVTKAPAPLASARGTASGEKSLDQYSPDELRKWMRT